MSKKFIIFLILCCSRLFSFECQFFPEPTCFCDLFCGPHRIGIGPEMYYMERTRETNFDHKECGWMIGERLIYERLRPWCIYYGADQYYASGKLMKVTDCGNVIKSHVIDAEIEGRIGYTIANRWLVNFMFTPFIGYGNFNGTNKFIQPSYLRIKFRPYYNFVSYGFISGYYLCGGSVCIGFNMKWKSMTHAVNKVIDCTDSDQPLIFYQRMGDRTQIQIDVPISYYYWYCRENAFEISVVGFYRNRIYGARANCPFDFFETKYEMWGGRFMINYVF